MRILTILFITTLICAATPAFAQFNSDPFSSPQESIELDPAYPRPGEEVTASLNQYTSNSYGSTVRWLLNGKEITDAENHRELTFTAGNLGTPQIIEAVLAKPSGGTEVLKSEVTPIYLDIVVEPQTRVPDFYAGRSLPSRGSQINATALVSGTDIGSNNLVYTWKINQTVIEGGSLRARNQVSFEMPMGDLAILSVHVTDLQGNTLSSRAVSIPSVEPEVYFYETNSLLGISQKPFNKNISFVGNSISIKAEPYYLDSRVYNNPDVSEWKIDRVVSNHSGLNPYEVTVKKERESGISKIEFHVRDTKKIYQGAQSSIQINY